MCPFHKHVKIGFAKLFIFILWRQRDGEGCSLMWGGGQFAMIGAQGSPIRWRAQRMCVCPEGPLATAVLVAQRGPSVVVGRGDYVQTQVACWLNGGGGGDLRGAGGGALRPFLAR